MKKLLKKIDKTGDLALKERSGWPKSVHTEGNVELVDEVILNQKDLFGTHSTPAEIAHEVKIDCQSVSRIIDQDLDLYPLRKQKVQKLTDSNIEKHMIRSVKFISKYTQKTLQTTFFSDEKICTVKQFYNSHKNVVFAPKKMSKLEVPEERLFCEIEALPKQIMVSVAISKAGKTLIVEPNTKVNAKYYCNVLPKKMIPEMNRLAKNNKYSFMQDGARAHTTMLTPEMLKNKKQLRLLEHHHQK